MRVVYEKIKRRLGTFALTAAASSAVFGSAVAAAETTQAPIAGERVQDADHDREEHAPDYEPFYERFLKGKGYDTSNANLTELLEHEQLNVREYAAIVLGQRRVETANAALRNRVDEDPAPSVRVEAARALGKMGDTYGRDVVKQTLDIEGWFELPYIAAGVLAELGDPAGYPLIMEALADDKVHIRFRGLSELPRFTAFQDEKVGEHTVKPYDELLRLLQSDPDAFIRENAAYTLGNTLPTTEADRLKAIQKDAPERVAVAIGIALEMIDIRASENHAEHADASNGKN